MRQVWHEMTMVTRSIDAPAHFAAVAAAEHVVDAVEGAPVAEGRQVHGEGHARARSTQESPRERF